MVRSSLFTFTLIWWLLKPASQKKKKNEWRIEWMAYSTHPPPGDFCVMCFFMVWTKVSISSNKTMQWLIGKRWCVILIIAVLSLFLLLQDIISFVVRPLPTKVYHVGFQLKTGSMTNLATTTLFYQVYMQFTYLVQIITANDGNFTFRSFTCHCTSFFDQICLVQEN